MGDLRPDNVGYYGKPLSSLTREELIKALLEIQEIIHNCPVKGKCNEILKHIEKERAKK